MPDGYIRLHDLQAQHTVFRHTSTLYDSSLKALAILKSKQRPIRDATALKVEHSYLLKVLYFSQLFVTELPIVTLYVLIARQS